MIPLNELPGSSGFSFTAAVARVLTKNFLLRPTVAETISKTIASIEAKCVDFFSWDSLFICLRWACKPNSMVIVDMLFVDQKTNHAFLPELWMQCFAISNLSFYEKNIQEDIQSWLPGRIPLICRHGWSKSGIEIQFSMGAMRLQWPYCLFVLMSLLIFIGSNEMRILIAFARLVQIFQMLTNCLQHQTGRRCKVDETCGLDKTLRPVKGTPETFPAFQFIAVGISSSQRPMISKSKRYSFKIWI